MFLKVANKYVFDGGYATLDLNAEFLLPKDKLTPYVFCWRRIWV
jgi:hypothetical protein